MQMCPGGALCPHVLGPLWHVHTPGGMCEQKADMFGLDFLFITYYLPIVPFRLSESL